ncbi:hypothetical protein [Paenibacillus paridis]|uniref:hypothetical protein n=1 Tax=Paenibacillus paridis TaxID=2583376 RepID=UPI00111E8427|nr:hypothetical protein [Paenibacillus paridis]
MEIGRKIYYDNSSGNVILITSEMTGNVIETLPEQDRAIFNVLSERIKDSYSYVQLNYGEYSYEFSNGYPVHISIETGEISWSSFDVKTDNQRKTIEEEINELKENNIRIMLAINELYDNIGSSKN